MADLARYAKKFVRASELPWREQYREFIEIQARGRLAAAARERADRAGRLRSRRPRESRRTIRCCGCMRVDARTQLPEDLLLLTDK